jgi:hypothetical protein
MAQEPSQIRDEIADTRMDLAETVRAMAEKADVKSRVREAVTDNTAQLQTRASELGERVRQVTPQKAKVGLAKARRQPWLLPGAVAVLTAVVVWRRSGRSA